MKAATQKISVLEMTTEKPLNDAFKLEISITQAWVGVIYKTLWMPPQRKFIGSKWKFDATNPNWQEVLPVYR